MRQINKIILSNSKNSKLNEFKTVYILLNNKNLTQIILYTINIKNNFKKIISKIPHTSKNNNLAYDC